MHTWLSTTRRPAAPTGVVIGISAASTLEKTTGDTFRWRHMFPRTAGYFGMAHAPAQQLRLSDHMPSQEANRDERPRLRVTAALFDHIDGVHVTVYKV
jgi:hypothetical protein